MDSGGLYMYMIHSSWQIKQLKEWCRLPMHLQVVLNQRWANSLFTTSKKRKATHSKLHKNNPSWKFFKHFKIRFQSSAMCLCVHFVVWWYNSCATGHHKIFPLQLKMESGTVATKIELPAVRMVSAPQNEGLLSSLNGKSGRNPPISSPTISLRGPHQHAPVFTKQFASSALFIYPYTQYWPAIAFVVVYRIRGAKT